MPDPKVYSYFKTKIQIRVAHVRYCFPLFVIHLYPTPLFSQQVGLPVTPTDIFKFFTFSTFMILNASMAYHHDLSNASQGLPSSNEAVAKSVTVSPNLCLTEGEGS
ncbi:MAG TPA: hypothetical protein VGO47_02350 [Chlamydiales bacterium]|nr:hypothetical protein [Chlamydiales bacterium]